MEGTKRGEPLTLPLYDFIPKGLPCCHRHALEALNRLNLPYLYTTYDRVAIGSGEIPGLEADVVESCGQPAEHGEHCYDIVCYMRRISKAYSKLVVFRYLHTKDTGNSAIFTVEFIPGMSSSVEHLANAKLQEQVLRNASDVYCYWCYPSIFSVAANCLAKGYEFPRSEKEIPHIMRRPQFMRTLNMLDMKRFEAPNQTPIFGFDDHHNPALVNVTKAALYRMGMSAKAMRNDPAIVSRYYTNFIREISGGGKRLSELEAALHDATLSLDSDRVVAEESVQLFKSNSRLVEMVLRDKESPKEEAVGMIPQSFKKQQQQNNGNEEHDNNKRVELLSEFIIPNRKQYKKK